MPLGRRLRVLALFAWALTAPPRIAPAQEANPNMTAARRHFDNARAQYAQGAYREAIAELEAAHALDPGAKDLVFNLGVVHEKLADIDEALQWFHLYTTMTLTDAERERADAYIHRLEGAKAELEQKRAAAQGLPQAAPRETVAHQGAEPASSPPTPAAHPAPAPKLAAVTIAAAGVAGAGLLFGSFMAVKATRDQPTGFVTPRDGTYADLVDRAQSAHREAIWADVGFGVAIASGAAAASLYLTSLWATSRARSTASSITIASQPTGSGGGVAVRLQGSF